MQYMVVFATASRVNNRDRPNEVRNFVIRRRSSNDLTERID
jgi:hypothetical protein